MYSRQDRGACPALPSVSVEHKGGLAERIETSAVDLPAGVTASRVTSKPGDASARSVVLELSAEDCSCPGPFRIIGSTLGGTRTAHTATTPIVGFDAKTDRPWLTIHRPDPVTQK